jgi:putative peptidoglycan lipid II flippase
VSVDRKPSRSLASIAGIVAVATLISKVVGLVREQVIAAAFGVGVVANAYAYAYNIPSFLFILLGGINGPFHSALVSVLAKRDKAEAAPLVETINTLVTTILLLVTIGLIIFAGPLIYLQAPGLDEQARTSAIQQLQIMAPLAVFGGLIGIGFGTLNAAGQYWLPSISPLLSSITVIFGVGGLFWILGSQINTPQYISLGGIVLAGGTLAGALLQWLAQIGAQSKSGMGKLRLRFDWRIPGVKDVLQVLIPATLSSGMLYINFYTALFFASFIENAAAAMRYANFLVITPLGIISNMILVPFLPEFSRLAAPENWPELKLRIRQGLMLSALTMLPITAIFMALAQPIIGLVYQRGTFDAEDTQIVAPLLMAYGFGMFFYLGRDVLVRVFYALGDGDTPFRVSMVNIFLNAFLDYLFVMVFFLSTPGLIFATIIVNITSMVAFLWILNRRLNGLPLAEWGLALFGLVGASAAAGLASWGVSLGLANFWDTSNFWTFLIQVLVASCFALVVFGLVAIQLKIPEVNILVSRLQKKFIR